MVDLIHSQSVTWYISKATGDEAVKTVPLTDFINPLLTLLNLIANRRISMRVPAIIDRISWSRVFLNDQVQHQVAK